MRKSSNLLHRRLQENFMKKMKLHPGNDPNKFMRLGLEINTVNMLDKIGG